MQRLRTTFKRSRTPTANEMKTQSSLEVPKQVRSASFDEIQLESKRLESEKRSDQNALLNIPQFPGQRSKSVDSGGSEDSGNYLEVPSRKFYRRRSSGSKSPVCVHCVCLEEYNRMHSSDSSQDEKEKEDVPQASSSMSESSSDCEEEIMSNCGIRVTLSPEIPPEPIQSPPPVPMTPTQSRRKSIHRQEAFFGEPSGDSLESISDGPSEAFSSESDKNPAGLVVKDIYLQVPDLKRDRAASVDSCFSKVSQGKTEELEHSGVSLEVPVGPNVTLRSRSVDIVLPTDKQARYKAIAMAAPCNSEYRKTTKVGERVLRSTPDWEETAINGDHIWVPTSVSGDICYVGESDCMKHGPRMKCSACKVIAHHSCIKVLVDKAKFSCKPTFKDVGVRQYREQTTVQHHWVHRRSEKGKCVKCGKAFQSKLSFSSKEIVAISCSWCKDAYHNKESCFNIKRIGEECTLGHYSHGMNRLHLYLQDVENGVTIPNSEPTVESEHCGTAVVNGNNGFGAVIGQCCMDIAIKKAGSTGIGMVVCHHSNHYGMAGYYALQAIKRGFFGISMTNTSPLMVPTRAKNSAFGTNPLAIGAPACDGDMFLLDMATTAVAVGKIEIRRRKNEPLPKGWALNENGGDETDPHKGYEARRLMPLGGTEENSGYKGYGLSMMVEVLCGILSGSAIGPNIRKWGDTAKLANLSHVFIAINPKYFVPGAEKRLSNLMCQIRNMEPTCPNLPVLIPGDPQRTHMKKVDQDGGLFYSENQFQTNEALAEKYKIKPMEFSLV